MIKALLDFARLGQAELKLEPVDLNGLVAEAQARVCASTEGRAIDWRIGPLPTVQGDRALLLLAFVNLLSNAVKYTREREHAAICVACTAGENRHSIEVRDNGVGFDMRHATRLFTPFERLHPGDQFAGTGMGLANVRRIVEKHGGSVSVDAQPGCGAAFTVVLP
jgi:signal transduction histidine kinase